MKKILADERGQSLVLVAAAMVVILFFTAITVDFGYLFFQRRHLQNTADAAALAAAWELPNGVVVQGRAEEYAEQHGVNNGEAGTFVGATVLNSREVEVIINRDYPRFFGRVFGSDDYKVAAEAVARRQVAVVGLMPFAPLPENYLDYHYSTNYEVQVEPILTTDNYEYLKGRIIQNYNQPYTYGGVSYDPYGDLIERLDDFKDRVIIGKYVGLITGSEGTSNLGGNSNYGWLNLEGMGQVGASEIEEWIKEGPPELSEDSIVSVHSSNQGAMESHFTKNNAPIPWLIENTGGTFYVLLPHPSIAFSQTNVEIKWGDYLIAEVEVDKERFDQLKNKDLTTTHKYRLVGKIVAVFNPLDPEVALILPNVISIRPYLIR